MSTTRVLKVVAVASCALVLVAALIGFLMYHAGGQSHGEAQRVADVVAKVLQVSADLGAHRATLTTRHYRTRAEYEEGQALGAQTATVEAIVQEIEYVPTLSKYILVPAQVGTTPAQVFFSVDVRNFLADQSQYPRRRLLRSENIEGIPYDVLDIAPEAGTPRAVLWIVRDSWLVKKATILDGENELAECDFRYRKIDGHFFPERIVTHFKHTNEVVVQEYGSYTMGKSE
ncbi:MAG: hypothetical protein WBD75_01960 [Phycisphaerae bacterium]|nr:hypothetical protein [Anaerolineales bacterium]